MNEPICTRGVNRIIAGLSPTREQIKGMRPVVLSITHNSR
jgi:hypothetical protein